MIFGWSNLSATTADVYLKIIVQQERRLLGRLGICRRTLCEQQSAATNLIWHSCVHLQRAVCGLGARMWAATVQRLVMYQPEGAFASREVKVRQLRFG